MMRHQPILKSYAGVKKALAGILFFLWAGNHLLHAQGAASIAREYQVKSVFLFNFSQFVEWPSTVFEDDNSPFVIGILGDDPFGSYLDETVAGEKMLNHPIVIHRYDNVKDVGRCQILFISHPDQTKKTIAELDKRGVLTVSDSDNFVHLGGMIGFFTENGKIRFQINLSAAKAGKLNVSSKLLRVAKIVNYKLPNK